jgi:hypothetical protein
VFESRIVIHGVSYCSRAEYVFESKIVIRAQSRYRMQSCCSTLKLLLKSRGVAVQLPGSIATTQFDAYQDIRKLHGNSTSVPLSINSASPH